jgi:hypothetical protein
MTKLITLEPEILLQPGRISFADIEVNAYNKTSLKPL